MNNKNRRTNQKGFTLIELMIVVAVIGVLATIAVPQYQNYVKKSEAASGLATLRALVTNIDNFHAENGTFPTDVGDVGGASDMNKLGTIALTAASGSTSSQAKFTFGANSTLASTETIILEKNGTSGLWTCTETTDITIKNCP
ncbi:type IV pilin protein [Vibrio splendidus]|uniref:type IV pilin protein n=1 Tax=Vibrio splendidus TaxID=29497 RepID=UPI003D14E5F0